MATQVEIREGETTAEQPVEETPADRPEGLPEKFNSVEDLAKSYAELESKLGTKAPEPEESTETPNENSNQFPSALRTITAEVKPAKNMQIDPIPIQSNCFNALF